MKRLIIITSLITTLSLFILQSAFGWGWRYKSPEQRVDYLIEYITDELNLTDQQIIEVNKIKTRILAKTEPIRQTKTEAMKTLISQIRSSEVDQDHLKYQWEKKHKAMKEMGDFMIEQLTAVHQILTPKQRERIAQKIERRIKWHTNSE